MFEGFSSGPALPPHSTIPDNTTHNVSTTSISSSSSSNMSIISPNIDIASDTSISRESEEGNEQTKFGLVEEDDDQEQSEISSSVNATILENSNINPLSPETSVNSISHSSA